MVAIVSGNGLGLFNTSLNTLGGSGVSGQAGFGQANGQAVVNAATGNLILQFTDEQLSGIGQDLPALRTYNALGQSNDGDADGWRWDGERRLMLTGTVNTAGSTVTRINGDGHETLYTWNGSRYQSAEGRGAHDSLSWSSGDTTWTWVDGDTRSSEVYEAAPGQSGQSRLKSVTATDGTSISYSYDAAGRLAGVRDSSGAELIYNYNAGGKLERLDTRLSGSDTPSKQVYYYYDAQGRLKRVLTDLTVDNSIADAGATPAGVLSAGAKVYVTDYTYDDANGVFSRRIASVSQSDGGSVSFTYQQVPAGGEYRLRTVTDASGVTTFDYGNLADRTTTVSNGLGQAWVYRYDESQRLVEVRSPSVAGQPLTTTAFSYDADSNVGMISSGGKTLTYGYDANGNRTLERDSLGNTLRRTYSITSRLLTETRYAPASTYNSTTAVWTDPAIGQTTNYLYDSADRLRYIVSAEGRVTEYRYNAQGLPERVIQYGSAVYTSTMTEAALNTWVVSQDKTRTTLSVTQYDAYGNLAKRTDYASVDSTGNGLLDTAAVVTEYTYSGSGQLLQTIAVRGPDRSSKTTLASNVYDGLGRLQSQVDADGTHTNVYDGVARTLTVTHSSGRIVTNSYDTSGRLLTVAESGTGVLSRVTVYTYDLAGRLVAELDPAGGRRFTFYDEAGRVSARVDGVGAVTEYTYTATGGLSVERRYATRVDTSDWISSAGVMTKTLVSQIRPVATVADRQTAYAYDAADRLWTVTDAANVVTTNSFDARGQLIQTQTGDRISRYFYDKEGRPQAVLDGEGYLTENIYNAAGQLFQAKRYAVVTTPLQQAGATLTDVRPSATGALSTYYFYDAAGRRTGVLDEQQFLTETVYDAAGNAQQTIRYATPYTGSVASSTMLSTLKTALQASARQTSTTAYDSLGRVSTVTDTAGTVTAYEYDSYGRVVRETAAQGSSEERSTRNRYDAYSQVVGQLGGEASTRITSGMADASQAAVYRQFGAGYEYDALGRKSAFTDAAGNRTVYYYDAEGRLTHTISAEGEVSETVYNAFGEVQETTRYTTKLAPNQNDRATETTHSGNQAARIWYRAGTSNSSISRNLTDFLPSGETFKAGDVLTATAWFKADTGVEAMIYVGPSSGGSATRVIGTGQWQQIRVSYKAVADGALKVYIYGDRYGAAQAQGNYVIYDDLEVTCEARNFRYVDGFEGGLTGWSSSTQHNDIVTASSSSTFSGSGSARLWYQGGTPSTLSRNLGSVAVGDVVTATVWLKAGTDTRAAVYLGNSAGVATQSSWRESVGTGGWKKVSITVTATVAEDFYLYLNADAFNPAPSAAHSVTYDDVVVLKNGVAWLADGFDSGVSPAATVTATTGWFLQGARVDAARQSSVTSFDGSQSLQVTYKPGTSSYAVQWLGSFAVDEVITATVWFKTTADTRARVALGGSGGGAISTSALDAYGVGDWQPLTVTGTVTAAGAIYIYLYADVNGGYKQEGHTVLFDNLEVASSTRGRIYSHDFESLTNINVGGGLSRLTGAEGREALQGGVLTTGLRALVQGIRNSAIDSRTQYSYDTRGLMISQTDGEGFESSFSYTDFGQLFQTTRRLTPGTTPNTTVTENRYNKRGERIGVTEDLDPAGLNRVTSTKYDAFGRVIEQTDALGKLTTTKYDNNGRQITVTDPLVHARKSIYDAYGRVLTQTDVNGNSTSYAYDDVNRSVTVTTPEGITLSTWKTRHGETLKVVDGRGNATSYEYNLNGQLARSVDAQGNDSQNVYDAAGRLIQTTDAQGAQTRFEYDAANRVIRRLDEATTGNVTRYAFDGQGRQVRVTEGDGSLGQRITDYSYDRKGQMLTVTVDPAGQKLTTSYAYDGVGRQLRISRGDTANPAQQVMAYAYDDLGRRISETQDPEGLNLTTQYKYDLEGRLTRKVDALGNSTWYVNDAAGLLMYTVGGEGQVTRYYYDGNDRVISTLKYANVIAKATRDTYGDIVSATATAGTVTISAPAADAARDQRTFAVYDRDGRVRYQINALRQVTETRYDAAGNVTETITHERELPADTLIWPAAANSPDTGFTALTSASQTLLNTYPGLFRYDAVSRRLVLCSVNNTASVNQTLIGPSRAFEPGQQYRMEITLGATLPSRLIVGLSNEGQSSTAGLSANNYRRHALYLSGGKWYSVINDNSISATPLLGVAAASTTYVLEIETRAGGTSLYVYEKGKTRAEGYKDEFDSIGWDEARFTLYGLQSPTDTNGEAYIDNLSISTRTSAAIVGSRTRYVYDSLNRQRFVIDPLGNVSEKRYDAAGHVTEVRRYDRAIPLETVATESDVGAALGLAGAGAQRTGYVYDSSGRQRFTVDALNQVTEARYDALGRVTDTIRHAAALTAGTVLSEAAVAAQLYPVWSDDLDDNGVSGMTVQSFTDVLSLSEGKLTLTNAMGAEAEPSVYESAFKTFTPGMTYHAEFSLGATLPKSFKIGLENSKNSYGATYRRHILFFDNGNLRSVAYSDKEEKSVLLGVAKANTTYVVEVETRAEGTTLYVHEKGQSRESGFSQSSDASVWADMRLRIWGRRNPAYDGSKVSIDNLQEWNLNGTQATLSSRTRTVYDAAGRVKFEIDPLKAVTEYVYDAAGRLEQEKRYRDAITTLPALTESGMSNALNGKAAVVTTHVLDAAGRERFTVDSLGGVIERRFNVLGQVTQTLQYRAQVKLPSQTPGVDSLAALVTAANAQALPPVCEWRVYDADGREVYRIDGLGGVLESVYDGLNRVTQTIRYAEVIVLPAEMTVAAVKVAVDTANLYTQAYNRKTSQVYDGLDRVVTHYDALNNKTSREYDVYGRLKAETIGVSDARTTRYYYDAAGQARYVVDTAGFVTGYKYDSLGRLTQEIHYAQAPADLTVAAIQAQGVNDRVTSYVYDSTGRPQYEIDNDGHVAEKTYDSLGRLICETRFAMPLTSLGIAGLSQAGARKTYYVYDLNGQLTHSVDELGYVSRREYDALGRVKREVRYAQRPASLAAWLQSPTALSDETGAAIRNYLYNDLGQLTFSIDAEGNVSGRQYDGSGQLVKEIRYAQKPASQSEWLTNPTVLSEQGAEIKRYVYDQKGQLHYAVDAEGYVTETRYNTFGQISSSVRYSGKALESDRKITLQNRQGATESWVVYDQVPAGATVGRILDAGYAGYVTQTQGAGTDNGYQLQSPVNVVNWNVEDAHVLRWDQKFSEYTVLYVQVNTLKGRRYMTYLSADAGVAPALEGEYVKFRLGQEAASGQWTHIERDLEADLHRLESDNRILSVASILVRGSGLIGDISLDDETLSLTSRIEGRKTDASLDEATAQKTRYIYDANGQLRYSVDAEGYVTEMRYDSFGQVKETLRHSLKLNREYPATEADVVTALKAMVNVDFTAPLPTGWEMPVTAQAAVSLQGSLVLTGQTGGSDQVPVLGSSPDVFLTSRIYRAEITTQASLDGACAGISLRNTLSGSEYRQHSVEFVNGRAAIFANGDGGYTSADLGALQTNTTYVVEIETSTSYTKIYVYRKGSSRGTGWSHTLNRVAGVAGWTAGPVHMAVYTRNSLPVAGGKLAIDNLAIINTGINPDNSAQRTSQVYDALGRVRYIVDAMGYVSEKTYDRFGQVTGEIRYETAINVSNRDALNLGSLGTMRQESVQYVYNLLGQLTEKIEAAVAIAGKTGLYHVVTSYEYDSFGNVVLRREGITRAAGTLTDDLSAARVIRSVYDLAGREKYQVDAGGYISETLYDDLGRVKEKRRYDRRLADEVAATESTVQQAIAAEVWTNAFVGSFVNSGGDALELSQGGEWKLNLFDLTYASRLSTTPVDYEPGMKMQVEIKGVLSGYLWLMFANQFNNGFTLQSSGSAQAVEITNGSLRIDSYHGVNKTTSTVTMTGIVQNDQSWILEFEAGSSGTTLYAYQKGTNRTTGIVGNLAKGDWGTVAFTAIVSGGDQQVSPVINSIKLSRPAISQYEKYDYDLEGQLKKKTDTAGAFESYSYDAFGNVLTRTDKLGKAWTYVYDQKNQLLEQVSPNVDIYQTYNVEVPINARIVTKMGYDAFGQVVSRTEGVVRTVSDDASQARTTEYEYDLLGRQTRTIQPGYYKAPTQLNQDSGGIFTASATPGSFRVNTLVSFDAFGNAVRNRIQVNNTGADATDYIDSYKVYDGLNRLIVDVDAERYTTTYDYDAYGNIGVEKRYVAAMYLNPNWDLLDQKLSLGEITYRINQAIAYAADPARNYVPCRTIITEYDLHNRMTYVQQDWVDTFTLSDGVRQARPTESYVYNAFGQVVSKTRSGTNDDVETVIPGVTEYYYYDRSGQLIGQLDAGNYFSSIERNGLGQIIRTVEFANEVTGGGLQPPRVGSVAGDNVDLVISAKDRATRFEYDSMGRQISVVKESARYFNAYEDGRIGDSKQAGALVIQRDVYDALGQKLASYDVVGNKTAYEYNALNQLYKVTEPLRTTGAAGRINHMNDLITASPVISYKLNAFGQTVLESRYAGSGKVDTNLDGVDELLQQAGGNSYKRFEYDFAGNLILETDPNFSSVDINADKGVTHYQVDALGRVTLEYQRAIASGTYDHVIMRGFTYDKLNRQTTTRDYYMSGTTLKSTDKSVVYGSFGQEVLKELLEGSLLVERKYDLAGRVIETINAQGTLNTEYDVLGNATQLTQVAATAAQNRVTTLVVDNQGRTLAQYSPVFEANIHNETAQFENLKNIRTLTRQAYDRWGNVLVSEKGYLNEGSEVMKSKASFDYDHENRITRKVMPMVDSMDKHGTSVKTIPIQEFHYDRAGYQIAEIDKKPTQLSFPQNSAPAWTTESEIRVRLRTYDNLGQLTSERDGTGTGGMGFGIETSYAYDINGNQILKVDATGVSRYSQYDRTGHLVEYGLLRTNGGTPTFTALGRSAYDTAGRLYGETSLGGYDGTRYSYYDERGNVIKTVSETGVSTDYYFNESGLKIQETDDNGYSAYWGYDSKSRVTVRTDLGGHRFIYTYNEFGQVAQEREFSSSSLYNLNPDSPDRPTKIYEYAGNGLLKSVSLVGVQVVFNVVSNQIANTYIDMRKVNTSYQYGVLGNKVTEQQSYTKDRYELVNSTVVLRSASRDAFAETRYSYDSLGRLKQVRAPAGTAAVMQDGADPVSYLMTEDLQIVNVGAVTNLSYDYDDFGNRRRIHLQAVDQDAKVLSQDDWYEYDEEGRILIADGMLVDGNIVIGHIADSAGKQVSKGKSISYNPMGQKVTEVLWSHTEESFKEYDTVNYFYYETDAVDHYNSSFFGYNDLGLVEIETISDVLRGKDTNWASDAVVKYKTKYEYYDIGPATEMGAVVVQDTTTDKQTRIQEFYDRGLLKMKRIKDASGGHISYEKYFYLADGSQSYLQVLNENETLQQRTNFSGSFHNVQTDWYGNIKSDLTYLRKDEVGNQLVYDFARYDGNGADARNRGWTTTSYSRFESYKPSSIVAVTRINLQNRSATTTFKYGSRGELLQTVANGQNNFNRRFAYDQASQQVVARVEGTTKAQRYLFLDGKQLASVGNLDGVSLASEYEPTSEAGTGNAPTTYIVQDASETLSSVAQLVWGDSRLWYLIADANGFASSAVMALSAEQELKIPNVVTNFHNDANTFKPYNQSDFVGDTTPVPNPPPPPKKKCNAIAMVIMVVIAAVVTAGVGTAALNALLPTAGASTAGVAASIGAVLGTGGSAILAGAVGAAAGSIASQVAGVGMGVVDNFSWKDVGVAALTGGLTAGIGQGLKAMAGSSPLGQMAGKMSGWLKPENMRPAAMVARSFASTGASYLANRLYGNDVSFNPLQVAAQGLMNYGASSLNLSGLFGPGELSKFTGKALEDGIGALGSARMGDKWFGGGRPDYSNVAADAFGNSLGRRFADELFPQPVAPKSSVYDDILAEVMKKPFGEEGLHLDSLANNSESNTAQSSFFRGSNLADQIDNYTGANGTGPYRQRGQSYSYEAEINDTAIGMVSKFGNADYQRAQLYYFLRDNNLKTDEKGNPIILPGKSYVMRDVLAQSEAELAKAGRAGGQDIANNSAATSLFLAAREREMASKVFIPTSNGPWRSGYVDANPLMSTMQPATLAAGPSLSLREIAQEKLVELGTSSAKEGGVWGYAKSWMAMSAYIALDYTPGNVGRATLQVANMAAQPLYQIIDMESRAIAMGVAALTGKTDTSVTYLSDVAKVAAAGGSQYEAWRAANKTIFNLPGSFVFGATDAHDQFSQGHYGMGVIESLGAVFSVAPIAKPLGSVLARGAGNSYNYLSNYGFEIVGVQQGVGRQAGAIASMKYGRIGEDGSVVANNTTAISTLERIEGKFSSSSREVGFIVDAETGQIMTMARQPYGQANASFRFTPTQWSLAKDNWITHNHPSGLTLGIEDLAAAVSNNARGIRASTTTGTYELSFDATFASAYRSDYGGAFGYLQAQTNKIGQGIMADVKSGALVVPDGLKGLQYKGFLANEMWVRYAEQVPGLQYKFIPKSKP